jgi:hypothetical protein
VLPLSNTNNKPTKKMKFESYIAKQVTKHTAAGFRSLLASEGFDSKGKHKIFSKITGIQNRPTSVTVEGANGESVTVKTA